MQFEFNENGVITGVLDSFCLCCETYLKFQDIHEHIADSSHQKSFETTNYVEKYRGERIRKMKIGYYCEVCNIMIQTLAKMAIHVNDDKHISNKNETHLKRSDGGIIVFDDILIEIKAWHALADGSCLICEIDYTNEDDHKNDATHILKLIQSKLELNENKFVYRKIDKDSYNCLICNTIITQDSKFIHCDSSEHKDNYKKCQENKQNMKKDDQKIVKNKNDNDKNDAALTGQLKMRDDVKCDDSKKNLEESKPSSESSNSMKQIALINDQKTAVEEDKLLSPSEALAKAMAFAKENKLNYKRNSTYCKFCDVTISSTLKRMQEHVAGKPHQVNIKKKLSKILNKVPTPAFINNATGVRNIFYYGIVINNKYCIDITSFFLINTDEDRVRCHVCETSLHLSEFDGHKDSPRHVFAMQVIPVLTDFKTEFLREIRSNVYHCGFCNLVEVGLEQMKNHLKSVDHYEKKRINEIRLQTYLSEESDRDDGEQRAMGILYGLLRR